MLTQSVTYSNDLTNVEPYSHLVESSMSKSEWAKHERLLYLLKYLLIKC